jgi:hypothetical protein
VEINSILSHFFRLESILFDWSQFCSTGVDFARLGPILFDATSLPL